ncbi:MAG TPA: IPT/TIG domain-containing protein, partial [Acidimicrobiales bacterium]|nr:IPT/TIG domain-containing protein [Acidimicrobiales bacterium]
LLALACMAVLAGIALTASGTGAGAVARAAPASANQVGSTAADPFFQDGPKLAPNDELGSGQFGTSVALSADGMTALIGAQQDDGGDGAAWVFTRTSAGWSEQAKLVPDDETGSGNFGASVALSADGDTALIGAPQDDDDDGAAWVFVRSGSSWAQVGSKLVPDDESSEPAGSEFGASAALSADGTTALIGGPADGGYGAAWVYVPEQVVIYQTGGLVGQARTAAVHVPTETRWEEQTKLEHGCCIHGGRSSFGASVALSSDGDVALVGDPGTTSGGDAEFFSRVGTTWTRSGSTYAKDAKGPAATQFGLSVALAPDGNTAYIGGPGDGAASAGLTGNGALWVYSFSAATIDWAEEAKVTPSDGNEAYFGSSVGVSSDGSAVVVGGENASAGIGAAWVYTVTAGGAPDQEGSLLTGGDESGNAMLGTSAAISVDAMTTTVLVGGPLDSDRSGASWVFSDAAPIVAAVRPASGTTGGGTVVTISGNYLQQATGVSFGSVASPELDFVSSDELSAVSPRGAAGEVDVTVTSANGTSTTSSADLFTYTVGATTTSPTTTTAPKATTSPKAGPLRATAIHVTVLGRGGRRELEVKLRVSESARLELELLARKTKVFSNTFSVVAGANDLVTPLKAKVMRGTDVARLMLTDRRRQHETYATTVTVPG